jgi:hypothetical protein
MQCSEPYADISYGHQTAVQPLCFRTVIPNKTVSSSETATDIHNRNKHTEERECNLVETVRTDMRVRVSGYTATFKELNLAIEEN